MKQDYRKMLEHDKCVFHSLVNKLVKQGEYEDALDCIKKYSSRSYKFNQYYYDHFVESAFQKCIHSLFGRREQSLNKDRVIFFDSFGLEPRGLASIYIKALIDQKIDFIYITYKSFESRIPNLLHSISESEYGEIRFISQSDTISQINELLGIVNDSNAGKMLLYNTPDELVSTASAYVYKGSLDSYLINLTDHAFWLGADSVDFVVVFRDYGANISKQFRNVDPNRIIKHPMYPSIPNSTYNGLPFDENMRFILSGGSLYKTISKDNRYYLMVDELLNKNPDLLFYYIGDGDDSRLKILSAKYPQRVYHSLERPDFYCVLEKARIYLNTYPMIGGLMTQYAAIAGVIPFTLKFDDCSDGVLLNPQELNTEYNDIDELVEHVTKLLNDDGLYETYCGKLKCQVVTPQEFAAQLSQIIKISSSSYTIDYREVDSRKFIDTYIERLSPSVYYQSFANRFFIRYAMYFKSRVVLGLIYYIRDRVIRLCSDR